MSRTVSTDFLWIFIFKFCYVIDFNQIADKWLRMSVYASERQRRDWTQNHYVFITEFFGWFSRSELVHRVLDNKIEIKLNYEK